jgi:hypothetical protein
MPLAGLSMLLAHSERTSHSTLSNIVRVVQAMHPTTPTPVVNPHNKVTPEEMETWDVQHTVDFLNQKGFTSYADHFFNKGYNGATLANVDAEDIADMPEKDKLKKKTFFSFLTKLFK